MVSSRPSPNHAARLRAGLVGSFLLAFTATGPAFAQLMLPGAAPPAPAAPAAEPGAAPPRPKKKPAPPKTFSEDGLVGKELQRNGNKGRLTLEKKGDGSYTLRLIAVGDKISKPGEACGLDLGNGTPLALVAAGRPDGVPRYEVAVPGCPVTIDMADQSVLLQGAQACAFVEADCRVDPRGLWGPPASELESRVQAIEADRSRAEKSARETFKVLMKRTKDKALLQALVTEQAGFTAARETLCRDYQREPAHGFCGARYTELRAASLQARQARMEAGGQLAKPKPVKPKPVAGAAPAPAAADPLQ